MKTNYENMILTISLEKEFIVYGIINSSGVILDKEKIPFDKNNYHSLISSIFEIIKSNGEYISGVSLAIPGKVDYRGIINESDTIPCIQNVDLVGDLRKRYNDMKISIVNSGNCVALSETLFDSSVENVVSIISDSKITGGAVVNGSILKGYNDNLVEFGNIFSFNEDWELSNTTRSIEEMVNRHNRDFDEQLTAIQIFNNFKGGEPKSIVTIQNYFKKLALLTLNIESILRPEVIIYFGELANESKFLTSFSEVYKSLRKEIGLKTEVRLKNSNYGNNAILIGAAKYWIDTFRKHQ